MTTPTETQLIAAAQAPRVTLEALQKNIVGESYTILPDSTTTICQLTLANGYTVTGESACASPLNFDPVVGQQFAKQRAIDKIWSLMGYELKTQLTRIAEVGQATGDITLLGEVKTYIGTKVVHAVLMNRLDYNKFRGWELPLNEDGNDEGYLVQYTDGGATNVNRFTGYVSWSPRAVFEGSYVVGIAQPKTTVRSRLVKELAETSDRLEKLQVFCSSETFRGLPAIEQNDLRMQAATMSSLVPILQRRLSRMTA